MIWTMDWTEVQPYNLGRADGSFFGGAIFSILNVGVWGSFVRNG